MILRAVVWLTTYIALAVAAQEWLLGLFGDDPMTVIVCTIVAMFVAYRVAEAVEAAETVRQERRR